MLVFALLRVWKHVPVENLDKSLMRKQKKKNHKEAFIAVIVLEAVSCGFFKVLALIAYTLFSVAVLILISKTKRWNEYE